MRGDNQALESHLNRQLQLDAFPIMISANPKDGSVHAASTSSSSTTTTTNTLDSSHLPNFALHIASALGHTEQVRQLLQSGQLVHSRDYSGHTPLFLALQNRHFATVEVLKSAGAHLASHEKVSSLNDLN